MSSSLAQTDNSFLEKKPDLTFVKSKIIINFCRWVKMCCLPNCAPKLTDILLKQYQISLKCLDFLVEVSVQFSSVSHSCPTLCDSMNRSTPGLPVHHQLPEFTQTQIHRVSDAIQPSHPLSSSSPPAPNPSQHQSLFQWVNSSHEVARVLEFQL